MANPPRYTKAQLKVMALTLLNYKAMNDPRYHVFVKSFASSANVGIFFAETLIVAYSKM